MAGAADGLEVEGDAEAWTAIPPATTRAAAAATAMLRLIRVRLADIGDSCKAISDIRTGRRANGVSLVAGAAN
ncbi:hypothetical protein GCM10010424_62880 [Streptomyces lienomycini]